MKVLLEEINQSLKQGEIEKKTKLKKHLDSSPSLAKGSHQFTIILQKFLHPLGNPYFIQCR